MAYQQPTNIDEFIILMAKADMRAKTQLAEDLVAFLVDQDNSIVSSDLGQLIDSLMPWLTGSHYKIAQRALEALSELISRLGSDFVAYTPTILPHVVDRLGDNRDTVREKAQLLLSKLMEHRVIPPQQLLDKLTICFKHKNAKVREEFLQTIVNALNAYGTQVLSLKSFIQPIVGLLGDPCGPVRDASIQTLVEIYKHVEYLQFCMMTMVWLRHTFDTVFEWVTVQEHRAVCVQLMSECMIQYGLAKISL